MRAIGAIVAAIAIPVAINGYISATDLQWKGVKKGHDWPQIVEAGPFYRIQIDLTHKGEKATVDYLVSCSIQKRHSIEGGSVAEGSRLTPFMYGKEMTDGSALVVKTPDVCTSKSTALTIENPPTIITYDSAASPWFGTAYITKKAYHSPKSILDFNGINITTVTEHDWANWRKNDKNWVSWDKLGLDPDWYAYFTWERGMKKIPTECYGASLYNLPENMKNQARLTMPPRGGFWNSYGLEDKFNKHLRDEFLKDRSNPKSDIYPALTDFALNEIAQHSVSTPPSEDIDKLSVMTRLDIQKQDQFNGFMFCQGHARATARFKSDIFGEVGGIYKLNGERLVGEHPNPHSYAQNAFINDEYGVKFRTLSLFDMGNRL